MVNHLLSGNDESVLRSAVHEHDLSRPASPLQGADMTTQVVRHAHVDSSDVRDRDLETEFTHVLSEE